VTPPVVLTSAILGWQVATPADMAGAAAGSGPLDHFGWSSMSLHQS
jgi:hypothetical protein